MRCLRRRQHRARRECGRRPHVRPQWQHAEGAHAWPRSALGSAASSGCGSSSLPASSSSSAPSACSTSCGCPGRGVLRERPAGCSASGHAGCGYGGDENRRGSLHALAARVFDCGATSSASGGRGRHRSTAAAGSAEGGRSAARGGSAGCGGPIRGVASLGERPPHRHVRQTENVTNVVAPAARNCTVRRSALVMASTAASLVSARSFAFERENSMTESCRGVGYGFTGDCCCTARLQNELEISVTE